MFWNNSDTTTTPNITTTQQLLLSMNNSPLIKFQCFATYRKEHARTKISTQYVCLAQIVLNRQDRTFPLSQEYHVVLTIFIEDQKKPTKAKWNTDLTYDRIAVCSRMTSSVT